MRTLTVTADELAEIRLKERRKVTAEIVNVLHECGADIPTIVRVSEVGGLLLAGMAVVPDESVPPDEIRFIAQRDRPIGRIVGVGDDPLDTHHEELREFEGALGIPDLPRDGPSVEGDDEWADALQRTGISPS